MKNDIRDFNITDENYSRVLPNSPLHWPIGDKNGKSIVVEQTQDGLDVYDNPVGVLTNNSVFPMQLANLENFSNVSSKSLPNAFYGRQKHDGEPYSRRTGSIGLRVI